MDAAMIAWVGLWIGYGLYSIGKGKLSIANGSVLFEYLLKSKKNSLSYKG